jgi:hypothetical protein
MNSGSERTLPIPPLERDAADPVGHRPLQLPLLPNRRTLDNTVTGGWVARASGVHEMRPSARRWKQREPSSHKLAATKSSPEGNDR